MHVKFGGHASMMPGRVRTLNPVQATVDDDGLASNLAQAAGVGVRQLQKLFRDEFDMSPAHYLRNVRLDGARSDLISGDEVTTVSDVAYRWGVQSSRAIRRALRTQIRRRRHVRRGGAERSGAPGAAVGQQAID
ncbi:MAG: helix-turn-helix transcriptional regulator [Mycobacterium sp.]